MQQPFFQLSQFMPILDSLVKDTTIISVTLISRDGLMVSQGLPSKIDERLAALIAAAFTGTGEQLAQQFSLQEARATIVLGKRSNVVCVSAGYQFILVAYIRQRADLKKVITRLRRVAARIRRSTEGR